MSRHSTREIVAGAVAVAGLVCLGTLLVLGAGGPGFLAKKSMIDVLFRDGHAIRIGCPVRVAGLDAGRVAAVELAEVQGQLVARVRLAIRADLAAKLRQDAQISIESGLTGQSVVNVVSAGRSQVALVPGQVIQGIESSFFDPILEQVGLGPVERNHLSHTIAEVRDTVDALGPRLRSILGSLDETSTMVRQTVEEAKPKLSETTAHLEQISARLDDPKVTQLIGQLQSLTGEINSFLTENRPKVAGTLDSAQSIARQVDQAIADERPRMSQLVTDLEGTRKRVDHVLVNAETITSQGASILTTNRGQIDRVLANVNLASDYGLKLVQKIFANPFYLSPFYKPTPADVEAQAVYDATTAFMDGAKEFNDAVKTLQAMQGRPMTELEKKSYNDLYIRAWKILPTLQVSQSQLSDRMRASSRR